jgi:hypothetical protein
MTPLASPTPDNINVSPFVIDPPLGAPNEVKFLRFLGALFQVAQNVNVQNVPVVELQ